MEGPCHQHRKVLLGHCWVFSCIRHHMELDATFKKSHVQEQELFGFKQFVALLTC